MCVIHHEKCSARQIRRRHVSGRSRGRSCYRRGTSRRSHRPARGRRGGEVEPLCTSGRHDVRGVAREEETTVPHRLADVAPHPRDALLEDRPLGQRPPFEAETRLQLLPDALVRPLGEVFVGTTLDVERLSSGRAKAQSATRARGARRRARRSTARPRRGFRASRTRTRARTRRAGRVGRSVGKCHETRQPATTSHSSSSSRPSWR